ncbi:integrase protein [Calderihabitans maritimus]|uniref:Integrase protein n=1 Tax=Calderihabitans maritimus TaxID=1246530 RepID=A0A1Z5HQW4_9FIRM|nr:integrase protein [Calderihabitans maritimus]
MLELDRDENGRRRQKWISVRKELGLPKPATKKQAEELLIQKLKELQEGWFIEPSKMTLKEYLHRWLEDYGRTNLRQTTFESYETTIRLHIIPEIGNIPLANLKPAHLQKLYADKLKGGRADGKEGGLSPRTVRYIHAILKEALKHAVKWELVARSVAEAVDPPKERPKGQQSWTAEEVHRFLEAVKDHRLYPLYLLP